MVATGATLVGCNEQAPPSVPPNNVFLEQQPPRYGHGGTQSPNRQTTTVPQSQYGQRQSPTIYLNEPTPQPEPTPQTDYSVVSPTGSTPAPVGGTETPMVTETTPPAETTPAPEPTPPVEPEPPTSAEPYGVPVPGKAGWVYSPHDSQKRYVDVSGIPPGTEVKCPYTNKVFLVP